MGKKEEIFIPFARPWLGEEEINEVIDTLKSDWLTTAGKTRQFEEDFAAYIGVKHAVGLTSCTAALHLALLVHDIGSGDEVILPSLTFASTANTVVHVGARPVFAEIKPDTVCIDPEDIKKKITKNTKAIIAVHYAGHPANLDAINAIAKEYNLVVIEDAAHAIGSEYKNKKIGAGKNTTCFSFYPTKTMTTAEGGMLTTDDSKIAERVRVLRIHGMTKDGWNRYGKDGSWQYQIVEPGWKYHMFDVQAAIGMHQLKKINFFIEKRNEYATLYDVAFDGIEGIEIPVRYGDVLHSYHLYPVKVKRGKRDEFYKGLKERNIGTSVQFIPLHLMPYYENTFGYAKGDLPATEKVFEQIISLPLYPRMEKKDIERVITSVQEVLKEV